MKFKKNIIQLYVFPFTEIAISLEFALMPIRTIDRIIIIIELGSQLDRTIVNEVAYFKRISIRQCRAYRS